jgi:predicted RNase H-like HicB family nuclease
MPTTASRKKRRKNIRRPFDRAILDKARRIAGQYQIVIWFEDGEYYGRGLELPMTFGDGKTPDACVAATRKAMTSTVAYMLEQDQTFPPPASSNKLTEQVNVRMSSNDKLLIESIARQRGYTSVADYLRAVALSQ